VVGTVRRAGHLAVFAFLAPARHPGFEVEFAIRGPAEIAGTGVDDMKGQTEALEDVLLDLEQFLVELFALLCGTENEHLDLGELMDAIQAAGVAPRGTGLRAEAV